MKMTRVDAEHAKYTGILCYEINFKTSDISNMQGSRRTIITGINYMTQNHILLQEDHLH